MKRIVGIANALSTIGKIYKETGEGMSIETREFTWTVNLLLEARRRLLQEQHRGCFCMDGGPLKGHTTLCQFLTEWVAKLDEEGP